MNSVHDMGAIDGFGAVVREENEPVFHHEWERRMYALVMVARIANIDEFRHAIERIAPATYLASSYYERWMRAIEGLLAEKGISGAKSELISAAPNSIAARKRPRERAKFKVGDVVRARAINPSGHTRTPRYVRGHRGRVLADLGTYVLPDSNAHHIGENRQHVYRVEFSSRDLFGERAAPRDVLRVDLWEDYLEPANKLGRAKSVKK